jgi:hypothetical protein
LLGLALERPPAVLDGVLGVVVIIGRQSDGDKWYKENGDNKKIGAAGEPVARESV